MKRLMTLAQKLEHEFDEHLVRGLCCNLLAQFSGRISFSSLNVRKFGQKCVGVITSNSTVVNLLVHYSFSKPTRWSYLKVYIN